MFHLSFGLHLAKMFHKMSQAWIQNVTTGSSWLPKPLGMGQTQFSGALELPPRPMVFSWVYLDTADVRPMCREFVYAGSGNSRTR